MLWICFSLRQEENKILTLQIPQAALHSSLVAETWFAWQSIPKDGDQIRPLNRKYSAHKSMIWFLQMAQLSTTMSRKVANQLAPGLWLVKEHTPCPKCDSIPLGERKTSAYNLNDTYSTYFLDFKTRFATVLPALLFLGGTGGLLVVNLHLIVFSHRWLQKSFRLEQVQRSRRLASSCRNDGEDESGMGEATSPI